MRIYVMKIMIIAIKGLLVANTRLGYVKLKFFTTKKILQLPEIV